MVPLYSSPPEALPAPQEPYRPERRGVSRRTVIEEAKAKVSTIDLADRLVAGNGGGWRKMGDRWVARCPLPSHEDRSPSFTVYPETNSWFCFGACLAGGDVVELARYAWGYSKHEVAMVAADLLHEFGHEVPERPESWHRKQERQKPLRDGIDAALVLAARRRLYRRFFEPLVLTTEDESDRLHDAHVFWQLTERLAEHLVAHMMGVRR